MTVSEQNFCDIRDPDGKIWDSDGIHDIRFRDIKIRARHGE
jgi:hypothetical protein